MPSCFINATIPHITFDTFTKNFLHVRHLAGFFAYANCSLLITFTHHQVWGRGGGRRRARRGKFSIVPSPPGLLEVQLGFECKSTWLQNIFFLPKYLGVFPKICKELGNICKKVLSSSRSSFLTPNLLRNVPVCAWQGY
jgi:hypothetical protein